MRMSCNGCRVLRKGCSEKCSIRPSIEWIKSPDSQANATLFLAKFYGRAGLLNLINAGSQHLRPAIFKSLLYEACGRIVNPTFGSVGLMSSGSWAQCQAAVDAVLAGSPIAGVDADALHLIPSPPNKSGDIRHVFRDSNSGGSRNKVTTRNRFKRSMNRTKTHPGSVTEFANGSHMAQFCNFPGPDDLCPSPEGNGAGGDYDGEVGLELTLGLVPMRLN
ncbi:LOB domain-containing protein 40 [Prunus yedoensis var. nudiflora]|uniref:LOB domain-containing protein 40 n=1 Tax=Prunus yedoensis var. nudiflora TaxID=2094558 RepID=A0A314YP33_PRUYE|nr:LOB domain-containing protein 40 [Prunus yedoensis var. nudiflora]